MNDFLAQLSKEEAPNNQRIRYAIYARFSDDKQNPKSVDDQIVECREYIEKREDGYVVEGCVYYDEAISGSHALTRSGYLRMLEDAGQRRFDVVVTEDLSRISRDQEDTARFYKVMKFNEIPILSLTDGEVNEITIGYKGTINTVQLQYLAKSVKRGQRAKVKKGSHANGIAFGYDKVREWDERGDPIRGQRTINEDQANIVRRIFLEYANGKSPRAIAKILNQEGIKSPRGNQWSASTINGNRQRLNGILQNHLYAGYLIYGRTYKVKHPTTGKTLIRINPTNKWTVTEVPELRIIEEVLWDRVQRRKNKHARNNRSRNTQSTHRPKYMLSGLIKCGSCGGNYVISGYKGRYRCSNNKDKGTCSNNTTVLCSDIEQRVIKGLQQNLLTPEATKRFVEKFREDLKRRNAQNKVDKDKLKNELQDITTKIERIVNAILEGTDSAHLRKTLTDLEDQKLVIEDKLNTPENTKTFELSLHPNLGEMYRLKVENLYHALNEHKYRDRAIEILRGLLNKIVVFPLPGRGNSRIEMHGVFSSIVEFAEGEGQVAKYALPIGKRECSETKSLHKNTPIDGAGEPAHSLSLELCELKTISPETDTGCIVIDI